MIRFHRQSLPQIDTVLTRILVVTAGQYSESYGCLPTAPLFYLYYVSLPRMVSVDCHNNEIDTTINEIDTVKNEIDTVKNEIDTVKNEIDTASA